MPDKECSLPSRRVPALISRARIIPGTPFRIVPISEKSGGFYPAGFTERLYPEIAYLSRVGGGVYLCVRDCSGKPTAFRRGLGGGKPDRLRERPNPPKEKRTNTLKY